MSNISSVPPTIAAQNIRRLRQAKRRGLSLTANLVANGVVSHVTLENVSATGMGFRSAPDLAVAQNVEVQLPSGRLMAAIICWVGKGGRIGVKLAARLQKDDPLLLCDGIADVPDATHAKPANGAAPYQFGPVSSQGTGRSILIADGFRSICYLMKSVLEKDGNTVDFVENGLALVDAAGLKAYDVVVIDSQLPLMTGDVAAARIRSLPAPFSLCSIIAVAPETLHNAKGSVADAYLAKPIRPARLLEQVAAVRARREQELQNAAHSFMARASNAA
jgi:CheY-like chemotaxis protein